ncbi:hypothetical protein Q7A53_12885 [Halobacillus rhizosphaerae]|uniref:hypothetical protein n=1 Tax=Halobacillus rhizosphaerae TaxID=3064889 RepID=UPI00398B6255
MEAIAKALGLALFTAFLVPASLAAVAIAAIVTPGYKAAPALIVLGILYLFWQFMFYILVSRIIDELDEVPRDIH